MLAIAVLAVAAAVLYLTVSGDYAFLKASVFTGAPAGQYHAIGERLAALALKRNGHLKVVATAGSVENIARLVGENGRCSPAFAFVPGWRAGSRRRRLPLPSPPPRLDNLSGHHHSDATAASQQRRDNTNPAPPNRPQQITSVTRTRALRTSEFGQ